METPWLDAAWMQRGLDALKDTLDVSPELKKQMIEFLLSEGFWEQEKLTYEGAVNKFNGNLNPERAGHFKPSELWALARKFNRHQFFLAVMEDLGYERPRMKATEERRQELLERIADGQAAYNRLLEESAGDLRRLGSSGVALRLNPTIAERRGHFAMDDEETDGSAPGRF